MVMADVSTLDEGIAAVEAGADLVATTLAGYTPQSLGGGYRVGIYASRNICTRIAQAGYAVASFVSDMSTGFSGNLGFPIPDNWVFDQFHEISGYRGKWDLDRVAYSGRMSADSSVRPAQPVNYDALDFLDLIEALESRFEELRVVYKDYAFGEDPITSGSYVTWVKVPTWRCVLNYLSMVYLKGSAKWSSAAEAYREADAKKLEDDTQASQIISALNKWIRSDRQEWTDPAGGAVDIPHMSVTTLGYINLNPLVPDKWTRWAGDLASALGPIQKVVDLNPGSNIIAIARDKGVRTFSWTGYAASPWLFLYCTGLSQPSDFLMRVSL
jgi:peptidoglycan hydrolase-like protein with peptidoglycan-binding domain